MQTTVTIFILKLNFKTIKSFCICFRRPQMTLYPMYFFYRLTKLDHATLLYDKENIVLKATRSD
ncbi:hypothetical protein Hanom_Chr13g01244381 [Helianthus anomalus]